MCLGECASKLFVYTFVPPYRYFSVSISRCSKMTLVAFSAVIGGLIFFAHKIEYLFENDYNDFMAYKHVNNEIILLYYYNKKSIGGYKTLSCSSKNEIEIRCLLTCSIVSFEWVLLCSLIALRLRVWTIKLL